MTLHIQILSATFSRENFETPDILVNLMLVKTKLVALLSVWI